MEGLRQGRDLVEQQIKGRLDLPELSSSGWSPSPAAQVPTSRDLRPLIKKASASLPAVRLAANQTATCKDDQSFQKYPFKFSTAKLISKTFQKLFKTILSSFQQPGRFPFTTSLHLRPPFFPTPMQNGKRPKQSLKQCISAFCSNFRQPTYDQHSFGNFL